MTLFPTSSTPPVVSNGLVSGINTQQIIQAMLQAYQIPEQNLQSQQSSLNQKVQDYQAINTDLVALQTAAEQLSTNSGWNSRQATSSDSSVATATASAGTPVGSVQFVVQHLAAANTLVSSGSVAATSDIVDSSPSYLLSRGSQLGLAVLAAGSGLGLGAHTVQVTQASQAASTTGTTALGSQSSGIAVTTGTNDTLSVTVDGTAYNLTIAGSPVGGYSGAGLLTALQSAITSAGASGVLQAGYDSAGHLILSTVDQGSTQSLQVTGGTALATLGLSTMGSAATGVDGVVRVDGTSTTLATVTPGQAVTLGAPAGSITATIISSSAQSQANSSLLSVGSLTATNISTGSGSLADLVANINAAGVGITASALQTGNGQFVLELNSSNTGSSSDLSVDTGAFAASGLGNLKTASAGANAQIEIGGAGGYTLSSQTNTFSGLLPGLNVDVASTSATPVTVTVAPDAKSVAGNVQGLVDAANTVLSDIHKYGGYDAATKTGGPLMGTPELTTITNQVQAILAGVVGTSTLGNARNVGLTLSNGSIAFDQTAFENAFNANPAQVSAMFIQGGSFAPSSNSYTGQVSLNFAGTRTRAGTYDVSVSQSAAQANDLGATLAGGTVTAAETLTLAMAGKSVNYSTTVGQTLAQVAAGINTALAGAGIDLSAQVTGGGTQLQLTSAGYGSAASFSVSSTNTAAGTTGLAGASAGTPVTFSGTDVAGTINGVAATGSGQFLTAPSTDPSLAGLTLQVTVPGLSSSTDLGSFTYAPGIAQSLNSLAAAMSDPVSGGITSVVRGLQNESQGLNSQISFYAQMVSERQRVLLQQFANLESQLGVLKNTSSSLASAITAITANG